MHYKKKTKKLDISICIPGLNPSPPLKRPPLPPLPPLSKEPKNNINMIIYSKFNQLIDRIAESIKFCKKFC